MPSKDRCEAKKCKDSYEWTVEFPGWTTVRLCTNHVGGELQGRCEAYAPAEINVVWRYYGLSRITND